MSTRDFVTSTVGNSGSTVHEQAAREDTREVLLSSRFWTNRRKDSSSRVAVWPLLICLVIALALRSWLAYHTLGFIDGDEALVGIQAQHILQGQFPTYFYNQPYMGSLEAYLMAIIFAIAGSSVWTLRAEPILLSLVVVWLTWRLAGALADTARLPLHARQWFMNIAALLSALPPLYDTVLQMRMLGGYIEIFVLMQLLLLSTLQLTNRRAAGASRRELALRWAGIGFLIGFGYWVNPLIIYGVLATALWITFDCVKLVLQSRSLRQLQRAVILPALASLPACVIGMTPALLWGARNQWQNFTYIFQMGANTSLRPEVLAQYPTRTAQIIGQARLLTGCVGPRVLGGSLPGQPSALYALAAPTFLLAAFSLAAVTGLVMLSFAQPAGLATPTLARFHPLLLRVRQLAALPLTFMAATIFVFCVTRTAASGLWNCEYDLAGRYATPLMLVMPLVCAALFTTLVLSEAEFYGRARMDAPATAAGNDSAIPQSAVGAPSTGLLLQRALLTGTVAFLLLSIVLQVALYGVTDPGSTFQSPYCTFAPADNGPIISYMEREHIQYAWAINWLAYPIVFKTHGDIIMSDPLPFIRQIQVLDRIPSYTDAVSHAARPSMVVLVKHSDPYPLILKMLDSQQVTYRVARFPAQEGRDVLVVTPLNKTVNPASSPAYFNVFVCSLDG